MEKIDTYMINKIFTVPYLDRMISENSVPESFSKCVKRYIKTENATIGEAISEIYHLWIVSIEMNIIIKYNS